MFVLAHPSNDIDDTCASLFFFHNLARQTHGFSVSALFKINTTQAMLRLSPSKIAQASIYVLLSTV
jgi:hypothetical protein